MELSHLHILLITHVLIITIEKKRESKTSTGPLMHLYVKHWEYGQFNRKSLDSKR